MGVFQSKYSCRSLPKKISIHVGINQMCCQKKKGKHVKRQKNSWFCCDSKASDYLELENVTASFRRKRKKLRFDGNIHGDLKETSKTMSNTPTSWYTPRSTNSSPTPTEDGIEEQPSHRALLLIITSWTNPWIWCGVALCFLISIFLIVSGITTLVFFFIYVIT